MSNTISIQQRYASIVEQASVCQVISAYGLSLFKKGKSWKSLCPFHDDRHPSLSVRHDDKVWKCFACGGKRKRDHLCSEILKSIAA